MLPGVLPVTGRARLFSIARWGDQQVGPRVRLGNQEFDVISTRGVSR